MSPCSFSRGTVSWYDKFARYCWPSCDGGVVNPSEFDDVQAQIVWITPCALEVLSAGCD